MGDFSPVCCGRVRKNSYNLFPQRLRALTRIHISQCFLLVSAYVAFGQSGTPKAQPSLPSQPVALVTKLYGHVIARHPIGIPQGQDLKVFAPYLSSSLLQGLDLYRGCTSDWNRKNAGTLKSPVGFFEHGIFSGSDEQAKPQTFHVEKTQREDSGHLRIYVRLTSLSPPAPRLVWRVAVLVSQERGRFVVDDIVYLKDENRSTDERLTEYFSIRCQGATYVGG